jgi:hypothetical protein
MMAMAPLSMRTMPTRHAVNATEGSGASWPRQAAATARDTDGDTVLTALGPGGKKGLTFTC